MTTMANIAYVAQYVGFAAAALLAISAASVWMALRFPIYSFKTPQVSRPWEPQSEYQNHRHYLGSLIVPKAMDAQYERQVNELRRHCRIGKITLKQS